jgi:hypothetical protein
MTQHTAEELEREAAEERARVDETIDAIQRKLTPGQLLDEVMHHSQGAGADFVSNLSRTLSTNPIPAAMIAVGLVWLMAAYPRGEARAAEQRPAGDGPPFES